MKIKLTLFIPLLALFDFQLRAADVLIVADEIPAMETLAKQFEIRANRTSTIVKQTELPSSLKDYRAVVIYVHKDISSDAEHAMINYVKGGGKLILLHHSISSAKRKNKDWLPFFQITLPTTKFEEGGYAYFDPATFQVVNIAPHNYVTTHDVKYTEKVSYASDGTGPAKELDAFTAPDTEIYLNHRFDGPRTKLLGLKWTEPKSGRTYIQDTAGWQMDLQGGSAYYFMVGHRAADFEIPGYAQILANALTSRK